MRDKKIKIEVFKLLLNHDADRINNPTFRDLFDKKHNESSEDILDNDLLTRYRDNFNSTIVEEDKYYQNGDNSEKAFTADNLFSLDTTEQYIYGILKGGFKGDNKTSSNIENKNESEPLDNKVIDNKHFFLLYTPLGSDTGFLIFQSYSQENIRKDFIGLLERKIFKYRRSYNKIIHEPYVPNAIKEQFKNGATVSQITYSEKVPSSIFSNNSAFLNGPTHYRIKVIIEPTGEGDRKNLSVDSLERTVKSEIERKSVFSKLLSSFANKKGKLKKNGKETPFVIGDLDEIFPVIYLNEDYLDSIGMPDFESIKSYSFSLLENIKNEYRERTRIQPIQ